MLKINGEYWRKYKIWVVILRIALMGVPAVLTSILEWLFDKSESLLFWLYRKLPNAKK